jgi:hypothetical protein
MIERLLNKLFDRQDIWTGCESPTRELLPYERPRQEPKVYMQRWFLWGGRFKTTLGFSVRVHKIILSDQDRELHDHPWNFFSIILRRGYFEQTTHDECGVKTLAKISPGRVIYRKAEHRHRIVILGKPAWTLVFVGPKVRSWGFWSKAGVFTYWRKFLDAKCQ